MNCDTEMFAQLLVTLCKSASDAGVCRFCAVNKLMSAAAAVTAGCSPEDRAELVAGVLAEFPICVEDYLSMPEPTVEGHGNA